MIYWPEQLFDVITAAASVLAAAWLRARHQHVDSSGNSDGSASAASAKRQTEPAGLGGTISVA